MGGQKAVVYPEFDAAHSWEIVEKHKVNVVFITGDAMGRPMVDALAERDYDLSSLVTVASSAALFSQNVKEEFLDRIPNALLIPSGTTLQIVSPQPIRFPRASGAEPDSIVGLINTAIVFPA